MVYLTLLNSVQILNLLAKYCIHIRLAYIISYSIVQKIHLNR